MESQFTARSMTTGCDIIIIAKMHRSGGDAVLAACDADVLGKTLKDGDINVTVSEGFFGNMEVSEEDLRIMLGQASNMNLFGEKTIAIAVDEGFVDPDSAMMIDGIPHVQIYLL